MNSGGVEHNSDDYLPVSRLAVAALGMGIVSAVALVFRAAWPLPLVAAALAAAALADLGRPDVRKAGRWAALAGLALAAGFGAQAVTTALVGRAIARSRAEAAARAWLDAVRAGSLADALVMCVADVLPPAAADPATDRVTAFAALPAIRAVQACGNAATVASAAGAAVGGGWQVRAELRPCAEPAGGGVALAIDVAPFPAGGQRGPVERWLVTGFAQAP